MATGITTMFFINYVIDTKERQMLEIPSELVG
jgi:hypothetical protein